MDLGSVVYLISLTCHHRAGFDVVERDSALQEAGVLQQETNGSVRATNLENHWKTAAILHVKGAVHGQKLLDAAFLGTVKASCLTCSWMIPSRSLLAAWRMVQPLLRRMASECPLVSV